MKRTLFIAMLFSFNLFADTKVVFKTVAITDASTLANPVSLSLGIACHGKSGNGDVLEKTDYVDLSKGVYQNINKSFNFDYAAMRTKCTDKYANADLYLALFIKKVKIDAEKKIKYELNEIIDQKLLSKVYSEMTAKNKNPLSYNNEFGKGYGVETTILVQKDQ